MCLKTIGLKICNNLKHNENSKIEKKKSKSIKTLKHNKGKDNTKNLFAKAMIINKKQVKLNNLKKFSTHKWGIDNSGYVFIDFETANLEKTSACQISMIKVIQGKVVKTYSSLIKPYPFEFSFSHIHGITSEDVAFALDFKALWPEIALFFDEDNIVVAHNADFDINVFRALIGHYQLQCPNFTYICSVKLFRKTYNYPNNRLNALAHMNQIKFNHHDPLADVITLQRLINLHFSENYHLKTLCNNLNIKMIKLLF